MKDLGNLLFLFCTSIPLLIYHRLYIYINVIMFLAPQNIIFFPLSPKYYIFPALSRLTYIALWVTAFRRCDPLLPFAAALCCCLLPPSSAGVPERHRPLGSQCSSPFSLSFPRHLASLHHFQARFSLKLWVPPLKIDLGYFLQFCFNFSILCEFLEP